MKVPIGEREGQRLEFKAREALADPKKLGAEVVAFLNTEGGDLYIGVREEDERAVAIEGIENAGAEIGKLTNSLQSNIEPKPGPDEIAVTSGTHDEEAAVIRVRVRPGKHRPYALTGEKGSRRFYVRIGSRNRPMTREELATEFSGSVGAESPAENARRILVAERDELQRSAKERFWIAIQPVRDIGLDVQEPAFKEYLTDPDAIGLPRGIASFHVPFEPELRQGELVARAIPFAEEVKKTVVRKDGGIRFWSVIHHLYQHARGSSPGLINPEVLTGVPLSLFRLAAAILGHKLEESDELVVDIALLGIGREGARLMPGRWQRPGPGRQVGVFDDGEDLMLIDPMTLTFGEIVETPERCVFRLLRPLYEGFGLREDAIPISFDRPARRVSPHPAASPRSS